MRRWAWLAALALAGCEAREPATADPASVAALDAVTLPGAQPVGWTRLDLGGQPVLLFYPAKADGTLEPTPRSEALARRFGETAAADLAAARGPARHDATPLAKPYRLILFAPGAGLGARDYRWLLAGLASRGALVAGIDPDGSPSASADRPAAIAGALVQASRGAPSLARFGPVESVAVAGHSLGGAGAVLALASLPASRAANLDGDFLGASRAPAAGPVLLLSGRNPDEPARADARRSADWALVANGQGRRVVLPTMRHLGATDAALLPAGRRTGDLGPDPRAVHRRLGDELAAFLLERP